MSFTTINPYTEEKISNYSFYSHSEIEKKLKTSQHIFNKWKSISFKQRSELFCKLVDILTRDKEYYAKLMTIEMGKPLTAAIGEIDKCSWVCKHFAENAESFLKDQHIKTEASKSYVKYQPLGAIFAVMPWNFPYWQVFRFAAPNIMAGNTALLKHSPNVTACAIAMEELFIKAGFPEGVFQTLIVDIPQIPYIVSNPIVKGVTLTGSVNAGKSLAGLAGQNLKKSVLELGGSDPYIILEDANLEEAVKSCVTSRLFNSGQTCISAKRFFVMRSQLKEVEELFINEMKKFNIEDPEDKNTLFGPLARKDIRDSLHQQVQQSIQQGAKCILGGNIPKAKGYLYEGTVLTNVTKEMTAFQEETFGPVAAIIPVDNEEEALSLANESVYGLGGAIYTSDINRAKRLAEKLETGFCSINDFVRSDPRLPFGGIKESGYGRELAEHGIKEFVNVKPIYIK